MKSGIILCSGGIDSVVTVHHVKKNLGYDRITLLFFDYGQRTLESERKFSRECAQELGANFLEMDLCYLGGLSESLITVSGDHKKLERADLKDTSEESKNWYVPSRNLVFLSNAIALAESIFLKEKLASEIFVGFKNEGKDWYPDTTKEFVEAINTVGEVASEGKFKIIAPLIEKDKEDVILLGKDLGVAFERTISCYTNNKQCGECLNCKLRQEGFRWAGVKDPTKYLIA